MGLSGESTGAQVLACCGAGSLRIGRETPGDRVIALAGNPNVGKSTVFNSLTGMNQHTGNWPGKTVANAQGRCRRGDSSFLLVDLPGTYSLMANSEEEEIARDFICFGEPDAVVVVADATCLERNLNLVLQILEVCGRVVVCVNLLDEAKKKGIRVDLAALSKKLGVPVVGTSARSGKGLRALTDAVAAVCGEKFVPRPFRVAYPEAIEAAAALLVPALEPALNGRLNARWVALRLLDGDESLLRSLKNYLGCDPAEREDVAARLRQARELLERAGIAAENFRDAAVSAIVEACESAARETVVCRKRDYAARDRRIDRFLTSKATGIPVMILLLLAIFWLTIVGANEPSARIAEGLFWVQDRLLELFRWISAPEWLTGLLVEGVYRTLAWVVSVMLPPMAIFFPLFTLLEDLGYLPRVAFNLDDFFRRAGAHGKQSLTMCMGFGCNACGVIGCRIIDSPRERLIAVLTNNFVPCNGRFPTLIAVTSMFFAAAAGPFQSAVSALTLTAVIVFGVLMTLLISKLLSETILKGLPSSFHLELPPYRRPQIGKVIVRSVLDRTLFVLRRAVAVAAPAGLVIWLLANIRAGDLSLLARCAAFLDPFARLLGLDGYILMAFLLGFPANEIVVPILIMSYLSAGALTDYQSLAQLHALFAAHGWTPVTAVCVMLFSLMHWPCGTTCLTIRKETQSAKWTALAAALPTAAGMAVCFAVASVSRLLGLA